MIAVIILSNSFGLIAHHNLFSLYAYLYILNRHSFSDFVYMGMVHPRGCAKHSSGEVKLGERERERENKEVTSLKQRGRESLLHVIKKHIKSGLHACIRFIIIIGITLSHSLITPSLSLLLPPSTLSNHSESSLIPPPTSSTYPSSTLHCFHVHLASHTLLAFPCSPSERG